MNIDNLKEILRSNKKFISLIIISVSTAFLLIFILIIKINSTPRESEVFFSSEVGTSHSCRKIIQIIPTPTPTPGTKIIPPLCPIYTVDEDHIIQVGKYINKINFEHHDHNSYQVGNVSYQTLNGEWKTESNLQNFDVNSGSNDDYTCRAENPGMYPGTHNEYDGGDEQGNNNCYIQKSLNLDECIYVQNIKLNITNGKIEGAHSHFCFNFEECKPTKPKVTIQGNVSCKNPDGSIEPIPNENVRMRFIHSGSTQHDFIAGVTDVNGNYSRPAQELDSLLAIDSFSTDYTGGDLLTITCNEENCISLPAGYDMVGKDNLEVNFLYNCPNKNIISCQNISFPEEVNVGENVSIVCQGSGESATNAKFKLFSPENVEIGGYSTQLDSDKKATWVYLVSLDTQPGTYYAECKICDDNDENCTIGSVN